eukprot:10342275-Lingulodinium_polyedra.AAC.1
MSPSLCGRWFRCCLSGATAYDRGLFRSAWSSRGLPVPVYSKRQGWVSHPTPEAEFASMSFDAR